MRWQVHGTDAATGQPVRLALDEPEATHAVQTALSKRIIVSHVTREGLRRALFPLACAAVVVLLPLCAGLYWYEQGVRAELTKAVAEQDRLSAALLDSEGMVRDLKAAGASLVDYRAVVSANVRAQIAEKSLAASEMRLAADRNLASELAQKTDALADARTHIGQLQDEVKHWSETATGARMATADVENRAGGLEKANKELSGQIDLLKSQLLLAAAKSGGATTESASDTDSGGTATAPTRWALRGYDAAANFVATYFEKETMQTRPAATGDDTVVWTAVSGANAATVRVVHDRDKQRVYSMTLTVSLATDAPKQKIDENMELVRRFIQAMAPGMKDLDTRVTRAVTDLTGRDASERIVLMGTDSRVTVWNKSGMYSWRVESIGNDLDE